MDITESIFGEAEKENSMNALRGFRIGDIVEYNEGPWAISKINSDCTVNLARNNTYGQGVEVYLIDPKELINLSRGD